MIINDPVSSGRNIKAWIDANDLESPHMGTSPTMINKHYGHLNLRDIATKFTGLWKIEDELEKQDTKLIE